MDNSQVTINTYTSEETNAAIQVQVEAESCYLAEGVSKDPLTPQSIVGNQKWECEQIQNICYSEVENKNVNELQFLPVVVQGFQPKAVCNHANYEYCDINTR